MFDSTEVSPLALLLYGRGDATTGSLLRCVVPPLPPASEDDGDDAGAAGGGGDDDDDDDDEDTTDAASTATGASTPLPDYSAMSGTPRELEGGFGEEGSRATRSERAAQLVNASLKHPVTVSEGAQGPEFVGVDPWVYFKVSDCLSLGPLPAGHPLTPRPVGPCSCRRRTRRRWSACGGRWSWWLASLATTLC